MAAESLYEPIPEQKLREARARLALDGETIEEWAVRNGYPPKAVYPVLRGERMAIRGQSLQIAIKLGLRQAPAAESQFTHPQNPADPLLAGKAPVPDRNRRPISQACPEPGRRAGRTVGEAVR